MKWTVATALALIVFGPATGGAFSPLTDAEGRPVKWPADAWPLPVANADAAWARAAATWSQIAGAGFRPVPERAPGVDGVAVTAVVVDAGQWAALVGDPDLVAFTLTSLDGTSLVDADVLLNGARFRFGAGLDAYDREAVLVHELGHVIGLGHTCGDAGGSACFSLDPRAPEATAVMYPTVAPGAAPRAPNEDDRTGVESVVERPPPARSLALVSVRRLGVERWSAVVEGLSPADRVRVWSGDVRVEARVEIEHGAVTVECDAAPPLSLEAWTPEGRGLFAEAALNAPDVGSAPDGSPDAAHALDGAPTGVAGRSSSGGCAAIGAAPAGPFWMLAALWAPRRRIA